MNDLVKIVNVGLIPPPPLSSLKPILVSEYDLVQNDICHIKILYF